MTGLPRSASLLVSFALLVGCDLVIEVGADHIAPVVVERVMYTGLEPGDGCPSLQLPYRTLDDRSGEATIAPLTSGCLLAFREEDVLLMPAEVMEHWSAQLSGYDMSSLIGVELVVNQLEIRDGVRDPMPVEDFDVVSLHLDGQVLFTRQDMARLGREELRVRVPQELVDRFLRALERGEALTAEMEVRIVFRDGRPVPGIILVHTELQPVLMVDAWRAIF